MVGPDAKAVCSPTERAWASMLTTIRAGYSANLNILCHQVKQLNTLTIFDFHLSSFQGSFICGEHGISETPLVLLGGVSSSKFARFHVSISLLLKSEYSASTATPV
jgi:hypothetical protein